MRNRFHTIFAMLAVVGMSAVAFGAETTGQPTAVLPGQPAVAADKVSSGSKSGPREEYARLGEELQAVQAALPDKKRELARLRHKWLVVKGRTPSAQELQDFEKKRAKGATTVADNPYINKNPLSSPAYARTAYYKKLAEVQSDEERVRQLEKARAALSADANAAGGGISTDREMKR